MKKIAFIIGCFIAGMSAWSQETFPRNDVMDERAEAFAFKNARIFVDYQTVLENATLLIEHGRVTEVGKDLAVPAGFTEVDMTGKTIYPGFIDPYTTYGLEAPAKPAPFSFSQPEQLQTKTKGPFNANEAIKAHFNASDVFSVDEKAAKSMRDAGFGSVLSLRRDGIARGTSVLVTLAKDRDNAVVVKSAAAAHFSFSKGSSRQSFPISPMGSIALLRQTWLDAQWYAAQTPKSFHDQSIEAWLATWNLPAVFETTNWKSLLRAANLAAEFKRPFVMKTRGDSYQRVDAVAKTGAALIVPVNFPKAMDVADAFDAERVDLADMKHWEMAPGNLAALDGAGVTFAITTHGHSAKSLGKFHKHLRKAIKAGLSAETALKALTANPAQILGVTDHLGSLSKGKIANFLVTSGDVFAEDSKIYENWIQGKRYVVTKAPAGDFKGAYKLTLDGKQKFDLEISGEPGKPKVQILRGKKDPLKVSAKLGKEGISLSFTPDKKQGAIRLNGWPKDKGWQGQGQLPDGHWVSWQAVYQGEPKAGKKGGKGAKKGKKSNGGSPTAGAVGSLVMPFEAYGLEKLPQAETILIKGATVWTNEADGVLQNTDVLVRDGKVAAIGKGLQAEGARVIDAAGKHLTAGIIDEHSHIALDGVNDVATNSGMVRMGDVVDSEDINIYRNLAGGVTAAQLLHGSANPVGGQSALIKMRWGALPSEMLIEGADGFIKFALGENVKRSTNSASVRYPQTRMGVEQVYVDAFTSAQHYRDQWRAYEQLSAADKAGKNPPRRDLVMDTMVEIMEGKRFITCHSYVQSEINMLMKTAERFGFRVNTFTHILEGYKVADKMAAHGVGGSTFADWWAYKWEVNYAIPYNPALMTGAGVVTAVNSDDAEMARRLNQEAAKSVKYGGMSEQEALKMVTLNPAKLLHLDDRMGSIKTGKDADLVVWSDHPLSIYAVVQQTMVDGIVYFDRNRDTAMRETIRKERARLIQKLRKAKKGGSETRPAMPKAKHLWHCDDIFAGDIAHLEMGGH